MRLVLAIVVSAFSASCGSQCFTRTALYEADGGQLRCVQSTSCQRTSMLVCSATEDYGRDCVACENNECVRYVPSGCK